MSKIFAMAAVSMLLFLTACAGAFPGNPQGYSGINKAEIEFNDDGSPKYALILGGKEQEQISLQVETPDGLKVDYNASGVKSFDGQAVRSAVEQAVSSDAKEVMPGIVDSVTSAVEKVLVP